MPWLPSFESVRDLGDRRKAWWSKPASTVVGATVHHSGRQSAHEVIPCQTCDVRPAMTYGSHLTCMGALQARFLRYHGHYDLMGRLPTAVVHRGAHDGRCWL